MKFYYMADTIIQQTTLNPDKIKIRPIYIGTKHKLLEFLPFLQSQKKLGIDVEFPSMKRYHDKISLIQIGTTKKQLLIDTEHFFLSDLIQIFEDNSIEKIFFDCAQDIRMIKELLHCEINNISDAQQYYVLVNNLTNNVGLDRVINYYFGDIIDSDKKHKLQKFDWRIRPLPAKAREYGASDVAYLIPIRDLLIEELTSKGYKSDLQRLSKSYELIEPLDENISEFVFQFKYTGIFSNPVEKLLALRIHILRMSLAKKQNIPFFYVLGKDRFNLLIRQKPTSEEEIKKLLSPRQSSNKKLVKSLLSIITSTIKEYSENDLVFFYEYQVFKKIIQTINKKLLEIISFNDVLLTGLGYTENMREINKKFTILTKWRKYKANQLKIQEELLLPTYTLKCLATYSTQENSKPDIKGISNKFWQEFKDEINFWLDNRNVELSKNSLT